MTFSIDKLLGSKNAGKLFDVVLVQLMLRSHVLGLLGHLVQEVPGLALSKNHHWHEVKTLIMKVLCLVSYFILPHEPVCSVKNRNDKEVEIDRVGLYTLPCHHC